MIFIKNIHIENGNKFNFKKNKKKTPKNLNSNIDIPKVYKVI